MTTSERISRQDLEDAFRSTTLVIDDKVAMVRPKIVTVSIAVVTGVAFFAYVVGRRGGRRR